MCMGVTAGAYIFSLFCCRERVLGLILVSPLCKAPSWTERFYNKVISNMLYFYGMCGLLEECLLQRYFSKLRYNIEVRGSAEVPESDSSSMQPKYSALIEVQACGLMVTEEQPHAMLIPMEHFFMGYGHRFETLARGEADQSGFRGGSATPEEEDSPGRARPVPESSSIALYPPTVAMTTTRKKKKIETVV
ncbi:hypothetical protein M0R45_004665 [Rubus argutus]|uniref:Pollen-specific protein SF21 n=1 Tax=Rubus argutus TaxID=59490 RepID=A0AAW1YKB6_RUBAR